MAAIPEVTFKLTDGTMATLQDYLANDKATVVCWYSTADLTNGTEEALKEMERMHEADVYTQKMKNLVDFLCIDIKDDLAEAKNVEKSLKLNDCVNGCVTDSEIDCFGVTILPHITTFKDNGTQFHNRQYGE